MNKRIGFFLGVCVLAMSIASGGCSSWQVKKSVTVSILPDDSFARSLVDMVFSRYRGYTRAGFDEVVSRDFVPNRAEFLDTVDGKALASRVLGFNYTIETGLRTGDKVTIDFSWDKKEAPGASATVNPVSGRSEFTFKKTPRGWGLCQVSGDDPF